MFSPSSSSSLCCILSMSHCRGIPLQRRQVRLEIKLHQHSDKTFQHHWHYRNTSYYRHYQKKFFKNSMLPASRVQGSTTGVSSLEESWQVPCGGGQWIYRRGGGRGHMTGNAGAGGHYSAVNFLRKESQGA